MFKTEISIELSGICIAIVESDVFSVDDDVLTDDEVLDANVLARVVGFENLFSL